MGKRTAILSKRAETRWEDGGGCKQRCRRRAAALATQTRQRTWLSKRPPALAGYVRKLMGASRDFACRSTSPLQLLSRCSSFQQVPFAGGPAVSFLLCLPNLHEGGYKGLRYSAQDVAQVIDCLLAWYLAQVGGPWPQEESTRRKKSKTCLRKLSRKDWRLCELSSTGCRTTLGLNQ